MQQTLLRQRLVTERTGVPRSSIYAAIKAGKFPLPVKLSARAVAWRAADIEAWIAERPQAFA
jgi:prophage regulatory protein